MIDFSLIKDDDDFPDFITLDAFMRTIEVYPMTDFDLGNYTL